MARKKFILQFTRAPGDVLMLTGLVRDLKLTYGDDVLVDVRTKFPGLWQHNPYLTPLEDADPEVIKVHLGGLGAEAADKEGIRISRNSITGERVHYCRVFHLIFERRTGLHVPCTLPRPDIHLTAAEKSQPLVDGRYWIVIPGGKTDNTCKWWYHHRYQEVVDKLTRQGLTCLQEGTKNPEKPTHVHPPLANVATIERDTSIRELAVNIYHSEGVICGCSLPMHLAGALEKPCVVLLGGREEPWYEEYSNQWQAFGPDAAAVRVPHRVLHTVGLLDCCRQGGCWKQRVTRLGDRLIYDQLLCTKPNYDHPEQAVGQCMAMITSDDVVAAAMSYYREGYLSPVNRQSSAAVSMPPLEFFLGETHQPTFTLFQPTYAAIKPTHAPLIAIDAVGAPRSLVHRCLTSLEPTFRKGLASCQILADQTVEPAWLLNGAKQSYTRASLAERFNQLAEQAEQPWLIWIGAACHVLQVGWLEKLLPPGLDELTASAGLKLRHQLVQLTAEHPRRWFARRPWHRGRPMRNATGVEALDGDSIHYVDHRLFAVRTAAVKTAGPVDAAANDVTLGILLGEQLYQAGYAARSVPDLERYVSLGSTPRPRIAEPLPWLTQGDKDVERNHRTRTLAADRA